MMRRSELPNVLGFLAQVVAGTLSAAHTVTAVGSDVLYANGVNSGSIYRIETYSSVPTASLIGEASIAFLDLAIDPTSGELYAVTQTALYRVDAESAAETFVGNLGFGQANGLGFDADGQLFAVSFGDTNLYRVDKSTGAGSLVGNTGFATSGDLAFDLDGTLFASTQTNELVRIDVVTGTGTLVGAFGVGNAGPTCQPCVAGLGIDASGTLYAGLGSDGAPVAALYVVSKQDGTATLVGDVAGAVEIGLGGLAFFEELDGDLDQDGCVDLSDLAILLADFGCSVGCGGDADGDGDSDLSDLAEVLANFGQGC